MTNDIEGSIKLSAINSLFSSHRLLKFNFVGLKQLAVDFDHPLFVYRLNVKSTELIQNAVFKTNKTKKLGRFYSAKQQTLLLNLVGHDDSNAKLYLFGNKDSLVELNVELDFLNTIVKVTITL